MKRKIIRIDEAKCTGCGLCIPNCAEGSLAIRDGKAVLVRDALCDGLGACLGHCPEGALQIEERDAEAFDEDLVHEHLKGAAPQASAEGQGCPSARAISMKPAEESGNRSQEEAVCALTHWPVQLTLLPPSAPFLHGADLLLAADCVPFAYPNFHRDFLTGRAVAVACPKLDNADAHFRKLVELFRQAKPRSVTVLRMEVPCCGGLSGLAAKALEESGLGIELREIVVSRDGKASTAVSR
jgi:NAD-dependent dihydropyrimidine dehydrogenase PreA subunit